MIDETRFHETQATVTEMNRPRPVPSTVPRYESVSAVDYRPVVVKRASWGAIFAGVVCALAIHSLLTVLGAAIGLSAVSPSTASGETMQNLGIGAGIWLVLSSLISLFVGGWVAGRLAGIPRFVDATLHGFAVWAATLVLSALLLTTLGSAFLGGALGAMGLPNSPSAQQQDNQNQQLSDDQSRGVSQSSRQNQQSEEAKRQAEAMKDVPRENEQAQQFVKNQLGSFTMNRNVDPNDLREDDSLVNSIAAALVPGAEEQDYKDAVDDLAGNAKINESQARQTIDAWKSEFRAEASNIGNSSPRERQEARQNAEKAREATAAGAWWAFFALLLGLGAAGFGGYLGTPRDIGDATVVDYHSRPIG